MWPNPGLGLARANRIERALGCLPSALACADGAFSLLWESITLIDTMFFRRKFKISPPLVKLENASRLAS